MTIVSHKAQKGRARANDGCRKGVAARLELRARRSRSIERVGALVSDHESRARGREPRPQVHPPALERALRAKVGPELRQVPREADAHAQHIRRVLSHLAEQKLHVPLDVSEVVGAQHAPIVASDDAFVSRRSLHRDGE